MNKVWSQDDIDDDIANGDDYDEDDGGWLEQECGLMHDGQCSLAGSEHCDFVCPYRDSEDFAGSAAWHKKHDKPSTDLPSVPHNLRNREQ
jgi:hypothetical protein